MVVRGRMVGACVGAVGTVLVVGVMVLILHTNCLFVKRG